MIAVEDRVSTAFDRQLADVRFTQPEAQTIASRFPAIPETSLLLTDSNHVLLIESSRGRGHK